MATAEETEAKLLAAGFVDVKAWLEPAPQQPDDPAEYLRTINLGAHLHRIDEPDHATFVRQGDRAARRPGRRRLRPPEHGRGATFVSDGLDRLLALLDLETIDRNLYRGSQPVDGTAAAGCSADRWRARR